MSEQETHVQILVVVVAIILILVVVKSAPTFCETHPPGRYCVTTHIPDSIAFIAGVDKEVVCCENCSDTLEVICE